MYEILTRITEGEGEEGDIEKLERLGNMIKKASLCGLGQSAPNPVLSTIKNFREEYEEHIKLKKCRSNVCEKLVNYYVTDKCIGCGACKRLAGSSYRGNPKSKHKIDLAKCINAGDAIKPVNLMQLKGFRHTGEFTMIKVYINDRPYNVVEGITIMQAATMSGYKIESLLSSQAFSLRRMQSLYSRS